MAEEPGVTPSVDEAAYDVARDGRFLMVDFVIDTPRADPGELGCRIEKLIFVSGSVHSIVASAVAVS